MQTVQTHPYTDVGKINLKKNLVSFPCNHLSTIISQNKTFIKIPLKEKIITQWSSTSVCFILNMYALSFAYVFICFVCVCVCFSEVLCVDINLIFALCWPFNRTASLPRITSCYRAAGINTSVHSRAPIIMPLAIPIMYALPSSELT